MGKGAGNARRRSIPVRISDRNTELTTQLAPLCLHLSSLLVTLLIG
jgi:hypothetical protein